LGRAAIAFKKYAVQAENMPIDGLGHDEHFSRFAARLGAESPVG
jgi:hypothetical protein